ncbi:hypothetical protein ABHA01_08625 [Clostridium paraputrificum]|uniref:hypothetical protein n=1 Tax=Clostridium paraputrificum TaxID=29363 RepID=UPI00325B86A5
MKGVNILSLHNTFFTVNAVIDSTGIIDDDRIIKYFLKNVRRKIPSRIIIEKNKLIRIILIIKIRIDSA